MILCVGEILVDLFVRKSADGETYERHAGGAPLNVACNLARLGGAAGFYGAVGKDGAGDFAAAFAEKQPFAFCRIVRSETGKTAVAFVETGDGGERTFRFERTHPADADLRASDIPELVSRADIVHLGSLPLGEARGLAFAEKLIDAAKRAGKKISFDVNFRAGVFPNEATAKDVLGRIAAAADIVKLSEEELAFLTGETDLRLGAERLVGQSEKAVFVTLGARGSVCLHSGRFAQASAIPVEAVDTTGAGDAFFAGVLNEIDRNGLADPDRILRVGNECGAEAVGRKGAVE